MYALHQDQDCHSTESVRPSKASPCFPRTRTRSLGFTAILTYTKPDRDDPFRFLLPTPVPPPPRTGGALTPTRAHAERLPRHPEPRTPPPPTPKPANAPPGPAPGAPPTCGPSPGPATGLLNPGGFPAKEVRKEDCGTAWMERNLFATGRSSLLYYRQTNGVSTNANKAQ